MEIDGFDRDFIIYQSDHNIAGLRFLYLLHNYNIVLIDARSESVV